VMAPSSPPVEEAKTMDLDSDDISLATDRGKQCPHCAKMFNAKGFTYH
jgi:hypothetical protein